MDQTRPIRVKDSVICREMDDELILLDRGSGRISHLNRTAGIIWYSIDGTSTIEEIYRGLLELFDETDPARMRDELAATLALLGEAGMIETCDDDEPGNPISGL